MAAPKTPKPAGPPVILFPLHGVEHVQALTDKEEVAQLREWRMELRRNFNHAAVKAVASASIELATARLARDAIAPGATAHDQGQAYGAGEMLESIRFVVTGQEEEAVSDCALRTKLAPKCYRTDTKLSQRLRR